MNRLFKNLSKTFVTDGQTQSEREALIDLLVWMMFADRKLAIAEQEMIDSLTKSMTWDSLTPLKLYVSSAITRTRSLLSNEEKQNQFLASIADRLGNQDDRKSALQKARQMAMADDGLSAEEKVLLERIETHF